jgi:hypothetical protein
MVFQPVLVEFFEKVESSIKKGTFAKLTLVKTTGDTDLKNVYDG